MGVAKQKSENIYENFYKINGLHPFKKAVPEGFINYQVRTRPNGTIRFFNFSLAKEMGLIDENHPIKLNKELEETLLYTFSLIIINEYDIEHKKTFKPEEIRSERYMATRYLQLQHPDKTGRTSGDGRGIWNGRIVNKGKIWDISSSGTGATSLSPACAKYKRYFESGDPAISYGCGYSEIDEGFSTLIFSEVFNKNNIETERILCLIEFENGYSISVRAHQNLLRPSHFFNYLKQSNYEMLRAITDYYIEQERGKPEWKACPKDKRKYNYFLDIIANRFAKMAARFEDDYIFCWLDWDGDNVLMDGGIIDYGSIRQFGLFHHEYRYDDIDRYSTTITEQKDKARYIVQTFSQAINYLVTHKKKSIHSFKKSKAVKVFDDVFENEKDKNLLLKIGFSKQVIPSLLKKDKNKIKDFRKVFSFFERAKSSKGIVDVADGISWDAIFCMRDLLRELPQIYLARSEKVTPEEFIEILKSNYAKKEDLKITPYRQKSISEFQQLYMELVKSASKISGKKLDQVLLEISMRSSVINKADRVTGDSITYIVEEVVKRRKRLSPEEIYNLIQNFSDYQILDPEKKVAPIKPEKKHEKLFKEFVEITREYREGL